jgi:hypothetical protein
MATGAAGHAGRPRELGPRAIAIRATGCDRWSMAGEVATLGSVWADDADVLHRGLAVETGDPFPIAVPVLTLDARGNPGRRGAVSAAAPAWDNLHGRGTPCAVP